MKKTMLVAVGIALILMASSSVAVVAGPPSPPNYGKYNPADLPSQPPEEWGVEKVIPSPSAPGGAVRTITCFGETVFEKTIYMTYCTPSQPKYSKMVYVREEVMSM
jgi:hypothetical protein